MNNLDICIIQKVDTKNRLVSAYFLSSQKAFDQIVYTYPDAGDNCGIYFVPVVGAVGLAIAGADGVPIIIGFMGPILNLPGHNISRDVGNTQASKLQPGEILLTSTEDNSISLTKRGEVNISSHGAETLYDFYGNIKTSANNRITKTIGDLKIIEGVQWVKDGTDHKTTVELVYGIYLNDKVLFGVETSGRIYNGNERVQHRNRKRNDSTGTKRRFVRPKRSA